ncbi:MAG: hypothetical protein WAW06_08195 [bacterium]
MRWVLACLILVTGFVQAASAGKEKPAEMQTITRSTGVLNQSSAKDPRFARFGGRFGPTLQWRQRYDGQVDLSGRAAQLDPRTGEFVTSPGPAKGLDLPADARWADGFGLPGTDSWVNAMVEYDGKLIVGGAFSRVGDKVVGGIAAWDGTTWSALEGADCTVMALAVYNGELIAGGYGLFHTQSGSAVWGIARWDGSSWRRLGYSGVEMLCGVTALAVYNGSLIVGGDFGSAGRLGPVGCIAGWDGTAWHRLGSGVAGGDGPQYPPCVLALAVYGNDLIAGGDFDHAGEISVSGVARWDGSEWHDMAGGVSGSWDDVQALTVYGDDLIVGGIFTHAGGIAAQNIAGWNAEGWFALGSGSFHIVSGLGVYGDQLVADWALSLPNGGLSSCVAWWDGAAWRQLGTASLGGNAFCVYDGDLVAGGIFESYCEGGILRNLARWDGLAWHPVGEHGNGVLEAVNALAVYEGRLVAGGSITQAGPALVQGVAAWDGSSWQALGEGLSDSGWPGSAYALATYAGDLVVGGVFSRAGDVDAKNVARWAGSAWHPMGSGLGSPVSALVEYRGSLFAACREGIHRWDGSAWRALGANSPRGVSAMIVYRGDLIAAGSFSGQFAPGNLIAAWDGRTWRALGTGLRDADDWASVKALAVYNGKLFVGGNFDQAGGLTVPGIACWDGMRWLAPGIGASLIQPAGAVPIYPPTEAYAMTTYRGRLFAIVSGASGTILSFDGTAWKYLEPGVSRGQALAIAEYEGGLYFGGDFLLAGGKSSVGVARWMPSIPETYVLNPFGSGQFPTIQDAIDAAEDGDTIELADGSYVGPGNRDLDFKGKALTLRAQSGDPVRCAIDAQGTSADEHRAFHFRSGESRDCRVLNLRITGGYHSAGGAILCEESGGDNPRRLPGADFADMLRVGSSPTFEGCMITNNYSTGNGGAVACDDYSSTMFAGCDFAGNAAQGFGGAVYCGGASDVWLAGCAMTDNRSGASGGGCLCTGGSIWLDSCVLAGNSADRGGGGVGVASGVGEIEGCTFGGNTGDPGSALEAQGTKVGVSVRSTIMHGNLGGSAVSCPGETVRVVDCDLYANSGGDWVGCVAGQAGVSGNFSADPAFCDPDVGDYSLRPGSPCLRVDSVMGEYHIGARGIGCE